MPVTNVDIQSPDSPPSYQIAVADTTAELAEMVAEKMKSGAVFPLGAPFVFNGCICQALEKCHQARK